MDREARRLQDSKEPNIDFIKGTPSVRGLSEGQKVLARRGNNPLGLYIKHMGRLWWTYLTDVGESLTDKKVKIDDLTEIINGIDVRRMVHDLVFNAINPTVINDGSLVVDYEYKIVSVGTSDFTTVGAAENTIGTIFTATGANAGGNGTVNVTDNNTVYWSSGDIKLSDGTVYSIDAGNTGNMAAITYIFLDLTVSETVLQTTTTAANAIGANRILIAVAQDVALKGCALFQVFSGKALGGLGKRINDSDIDTVSIVKDKTPQLGGELDAQANSIGFTQQSATGDGATNIDWKLGNKFKFTFGAMNETFTFTAPTKPCNLLLMLVQDGVGSRTATFPVSVKWNNNTAPTLSTAAAAVDIVSMYWDGTSYFCAANLNFL